MSSKTQLLLQQLGELDDIDRDFVDEECLRRYCNACFGDIKAAASQLKRTLEWRKTFKPDLKLTEEIEAFVLKEKHYLAGVAGNGVPAMVTRKRMQRLLPEEEDVYLRYLIYTVEKTILTMENGVEHWVWILDLKGYTSGNSPRLSMTRKTVKILADHYPERLRRAYIVDAPTVFYVLYKMIYPFLDKITQQKIAFVYSAHYDDNGKLLTGKEDPTEFEQYYELYDKAYDPISYLAHLKESERFEAISAEDRDSG